MHVSEIGPQAIALRKSLMCIIHTPNLPQKCDQVLCEFMCIICLVYHMDQIPQMHVSKICSNNVTNCFANVSYVIYTPNLPQK